MRINCRHYESRSYPNGDTVRKCDLDLAPEAPWRCPEVCESFTPRVIDGGWHYGSLQPDLDVAEPASVGSDDSIAALLDSAEDIVNDAGPRVLAEIEADRAASRRGLRGLFRRLRRR